jgi:hypothetical protein
MSQWDISPWPDPANGARLADEVQSREMRRRLALAARDAHHTIPIVMSASGDPLGVGLAASLSHPGETSLA